MKYDANQTFGIAASCAAIGWKVVRLYGVRNGGKCTCGRPECSTPGKHPAGGQWQHLATDDEEEIANWFDFTNENQSRRVNCGVLLGPASGIIDVEADDEDAKKVIKRFDLDQIDTTAYRSTRGEHYLFQYESDLPDQAVIKVDGLEVRTGGGGKAAQSVLPGSWHQSGIQYKWLPGRSPEQVRPAKLPENFKKAILENSKSKGSGCISQALGHLRYGKKITAGGRHAFLLGVASWLANQKSGQFKAADLETALQLLSAVNATNCEPPKDLSDIAKIMNDQWAYYRDRREALVAERPLEQAGLDFNEDTREYDPGRWQLTVVHSEPKSYRLTIPSEEDKRPYDVWIDNAKTLQSSRDVASAILAQSNRLDVLDPSPSSWSKVWNGDRTRNEDGLWVEKRSLRIKLLNAASDEWPTSDQSEIDTAAEVFLSYMESFRKEEGDDEDVVRPISDGTPRWIRDKDGEWHLYLKVTTAYAQACKRAAITPFTPALWRRLSGRWREHCTPELLSKSGYLPQKVTNSTIGSRDKFYVLVDKHLEALGRVAGRN